MSRIFRGGGGKWEVRSVAAERPSLNPYSPAVFFLYRMDFFFPCQIRMEFFFKGKEDHLCIQWTHAFAGGLGRKKPQTAHFLLLETESGGTMALTGPSPACPDAGDRQQSCPLDYSFFCLFGAGTVITKYWVLLTFEFSLGFQALSFLANVFCLHLFSLPTALPLLGALFYSLGHISPPLDSWPPFSPFQATYQTLFDLPKSALMSFWCLQQE